LLAQNTQVYNPTHDKTSQLLHSLSLPFTTLLQVKHIIRHSIFLNSSFLPLTLALCRGTQGGLSKFCFASGDLCLLCLFLLVAFFLFGL
jgi:hypothetical protein